MKKLLLCTDGSAYSGTACQYGAWVAGRTGAHIDLLYVSNMAEYEAPFLMDLGGSIGASPYIGIVDQLTEIEKEKAKMIEEYALQTIEKAEVSVPVVFHHDTGTLVDSVEQYLPEEGGLIILGKRGINAETAMEHLGHDMERVVRSSNMPCLVTNRVYRDIKRVVFAYDGGESCQKALAWMCRSKLLKGLDLHLISVGEGHGKGEASSRVAEAEPKLREAGLTVTSQVLTGDVENSIEGYVVDSKADMLVMGAYGHSRIRQLIIGSTTSDLLRRCRVPVLLFR
ncbi:universal stress protein [Ruficoccus sp. ZRK36]|uniref:universal stress protein n=1 Tax=Ruficoccus sp. ZRK36 TaxID=2866311 RepID=UPI001C73421D|nr:universal stress protein [Ruficoccus sp. ZRK36]QYY36509.1 universal stress protein [Ruficoccus sp. ZRK36]